VFFPYAVIREAVPIMTAAVHFKLDLKPHPDSKGIFRTHCPQCEEKGGHSLTITPHLGLFTCWKTRDPKTGKPLRGDVIRLAAHLRATDENPAALYLVEAFNIPNPSEEVQPKEKPMKAYRTTPLQAAEAPVVPKKEGFDRAKYQGNLDRSHKLLEGLDPEFCRRADIGVPTRSTFKGEIVFPVYDKDTMEFMEYVAITWEGKIKRYKRRGNE